MKMEELMYFNGFGGFSKDGKEYCIRVAKNERTPLPWSHLLVNKKIGTLVTSNGGGFSWYGNSRENKITSWSNDVILDTPPEKILIEDEKNSWSALPDKILEKEIFKITYGFGYANYCLESERYEQDVTIFVTENPAQKVSILKIKNKNEETRNLKIKFMADVVLGVAKEYTEKHIVYEIKDDLLCAYNNYSNDYDDYHLFIKMFSFGDEQVKICKDFEKTEKEMDKKIGKEESDEASKEVDKETSKEVNKEKNYIELEVNLELKPQEERELVVVLQYVKKQEEFVGYSLEEYKKLLQEEKDTWKERLEKVQITTPVDSMNIILNGWILYQNMASRIWGRASFYQSGGAYGFRDQLQDMLAILYIEPQMARNQIIYHAKHQFAEGDVLHWWHPERNNGIRTRFSDDLLWLVYLTCEYVEFTSDFDILFEECNFIEGRKLQPNEDEIYIETKQSKETVSLVEHCIKAIERSLEFGTHGLPKMGSGDWNDGMNTVGGESVWLGFFLADILKKFLMMIKNEEFENLIKKCEKTELKDEIKKLKIKYEEKYLELQRNLDTAWDGRWFKRAYFKDGQALGSNENDECKIDNISQSWSVISGASKKEKQMTAMESVENYLVDHENMFIKLLTPAFCNTKMEPGYIKSYIPRSARKWRTVYTWGDLGNLSKLFIK